MQPLPLMLLRCHCCCSMPLPFRGLRTVWQFTGVSAEQEGREEGEVVVQYRGSYLGSV